MVIALKFLAIGFLLYSQDSAHAFVRTLGLTGNPLVLSGAATTLHVNPTNSSGLSQADVTSIIQNSTQQWMDGDTRLNISLDVNVAHNPVSDYDGKNTVFFASAGSRDIGFNVIGVTEITYFVASGEMANIDIVFNDRDFVFTNNVGDTGTVAGGFTQIFLGDVATHELGHAWGLDHSTVNHAALIFTAFSGQYRTSADDRTAMRAIYPSAQGTNSVGAIVGSVRGTQGGIFGAHVVAVDVEAGKAIAGTLTSTDGSFYFGALPGGKSYSLFVEPLLTSTSTISAYYGNVDHRFCPGGTRFRRTVRSACGAEGVADVVGLAVGGYEDVGVIAPACELFNHSGSQPTDINQAREIASAGGAMFSEISPGTTHYYRINNFSGNLKANLLAYGLFAPIDVKVEIVDSLGAAIAGSTSVDDIENPMPGGYVNYDSRAEGVNLGLGDYWLKVEAKAGLLPTTFFPAGAHLSDTAGFYLLSVSAGGQVAANRSPAMTACLAVQNTPQAGLAFAPRRTTNRSDTAGSGCGTIAVTGAGGGNGPGAGAAANLITIFTVGLLAWAFVRLRFPLVDPASGLRVQ